MEHAKLQIIVLVKLVGKVMIVLFVLKTLDASMDIVMNPSNVNVIQVGLDLNVKQVDKTST